METPSFDDIRNELRKRLTGRGVERALVFGSYARGTQDRRSDVDLIIVVPTEKRFFDRYEEFLDLMILKRGPAVDLLIYSPEEWRSMQDRPFIRQAVREGKVVYEQ